MNCIFCNRPEVHLSKTEHFFCDYCSNNWNVMSVFTDEERLELSWYSMMNNQYTVEVDILKANTKVYYAYKFGQGEKLITELPEALDLKPENIQPFLDRLEKLKVFL